ncbi:MAG: hypothetical protein M3362_25435 [Acidobacteriota bacterium]|nr:hypothetical protein [Acidobacteriota bacterium]
MKIKIHKSQDGSRSEYIYDDAEVQVRTTDYDADGNIICDIHYENNGHGKITGWRVYNSEGVMFRRYEVDYYSSGLESESREYDDDGNLIRRTVLSYDPNNFRTEEHYFDSQGVLRGKGIIERNQRGEYIDTKYYDMEGNALSNPAA